MFITHDLSVVEYISDRIVVMYLGRMVEMADTQELFENTLHPYTRALLSAIPIADIDRRRKRIPLQGDVPSPVNPPSGCPFHPRCPECMERCKTEVPHPVIITRDGREHMVCCHRVQANAGGGNDFKTHI
jgi:oligopeptide/dipeptide ABC transporter ATP-binding protein